jgi:Spy/CpxP family protein refolding chaperone
MFKRLLIAGAVVMFFITAGNAYSQHDSLKRNDGRKFKKAVKEKFMEKLSIDEPTADKYLEMYSAHRKSISDLHKRHSDLLKSLEENIDSPDLSTKLDEIANIDMMIAQKKLDFYESSKKILTPKQIVQSLQFQKELGKFVKKEMHRKG